MVEFTPEETATWGAVWRALRRLHATHACREYREGFELCERLCGLCEQRVPQLRDLSNFLKGAPFAFPPTHFHLHMSHSTCALDSAHRLHDPAGRRLPVAARLPQWPRVPRVLRHAVRAPPLAAALHARTVPPLAGSLCSLHFTSVHQLSSG